MKARHTNAVAREWRAHRHVWHNGSTYEVGNDHLAIQEVTQIDELMRKVAKSTGPLFGSATRPSGRTGGSTPLGCEFLRLFEQRNSQIAALQFPRHRLSPFFELWERHCRKPPAGIIDPSMVTRAQLLNAIVDAMRMEARSKGFVRKVDNIEKSARKNWSSLESYIDSMLARYARLLVIRVDVGYPNLNYDTGKRFVPCTDRQFKAHLRGLIVDIRRIQPLCGYVWKVEFGPGRGHHAHLMIFLNGSEAQQSISWGRHVGEAWVRVTGGLGTYWNGNAHEDAFERRGLRGIGMIRSTDQVRVRNLKRAGLYLAKADYFCRFQSPEFGRMFGHGHLKERCVKRGRPRLAVASSTEPGQD